MYDKKYNESLVSVIVTCYNLGEYIDEAVNSVLNSTFQDFEIVIVNDGSTDEYTNNKLLNYNKPKTKVFNIKNCGVCNARNFAVKNSNGKYILPLDADDKIAETYIEKAVEVLENDNNIKIVYCDAEKFGEETGKWELEDYSFENMLKGSLIFVTSLFRRKDYNKTIGWNPNIKQTLEDWDFWLSILENGGAAYKLPETLFYYRIRKGSRTQFLHEGNYDVWKKDLRQVYLNHLKLFSENFDDPLNLYYENLQIKEQLSQKNNYFISLPEYKLGYYLLKPFRIIQSLFVQKK